jgi:hypothetical protein
VTFCGGVRAAYRSSVARARGVTQAASNGGLRASVIATGADSRLELRASGRPHRCVDADLACAHRCHRRGYTDARKGLARGHRRSPLDWQRLDRSAYRGVAQRKSSALKSLAGVAYAQCVAATVAEYPDRRGHGRVETWLSRSERWTHTQTVSSQGLARSGLTDLGHFRLSPDAIG